MGYYLGIDVGTSSVKVCAVNGTGESVTARAPYTQDDGKTPKSWWSAIISGVKILGETVDLSMTKGIGLTTQVGTYVLYRSDVAENDLSVTGWNTAGGEAELESLVQSRPRSFYIDHISMPHPQIVSYPAPRLMWLKKHESAEYDKAEKLLAPKDWLYLRLTGKIASDYFSWNGFVDNKKGEVSKEILSLTGILREKLPDMFKPMASPGKLSEKASKELGLPAGIPVTLGCNDCHASLVGMGITEIGQKFDLTGTSEHIGLITDAKDGDDAFTWSPFFEGTCAFGVTASSGPSIDWGFSKFGAYGDDLESIYMATLSGDKKPPIFLPYLCGERSPIWDMSARGAFVGISNDTTDRDLMYSILEGVVFSLWHIWEHLSPTQRGGNEPFRLGGGGAKNTLLGQMKADLFNREFEIPKEKESGALGAAMLCATGNGAFETLRDAAKACGSTDTKISPKNSAEALHRRFEIYRSLYPSIKDKLKYF